ncbi:MAG: hypothetical protein WC326_13320 [Candidatus Delongbacteria bacterium]
MSRLPRSTYLTLSLSALIWCLSLGCESKDDDSSTFCLSQTGTFENIYANSIQWDGSGFLCGAGNRLLQLGLASGSPVLLGQLWLIDCNLLATSGQRGVAGGYRGFQLFSWTDAGGLQEGAVMDSVAGLRALDMEGDLVAAALDEQGIWLLDVADPQAPARLALIPNGDPSLHVWFRSLQLSGDRLYALSQDWEQDLAVYDISDPQSPVLLGTADTYGGEFALAQERVYLLDDVDGLYALRALDLRDPAHPVAGGTCITSPYSLSDFRVSGTRLYAVGRAELGIQPRYRLYEFDIEDPDNPRLNGLVELERPCYTIGVGEEYVLVKQERVDEAAASMDLYSTCDGWQP